MDNEHDFIFGSCKAELENIERNKVTIFEQEAIDKKKKIRRNTKAALITALILLLIYGFVFLCSIPRAAYWIEIICAIALVAGVAITLVYCLFRFIRDVFLYEK